MSISSFVEPREQVQEALNLVARLEKGEVPTKLPWENWAFQKAVLQHFSTSRKSIQLAERDLRDLEAIKRVFGGHQ